MLLYHADIFETVESAGSFHIDAEVTDVDFAEMVREVNEEVSADADSIRHGLRPSSQHDLYEGEGRFVDERTIEIVGDEDEGARIRAETVLIAAGTRPAVPDIDGIDDVNYLTSTEALQLETPPDHLVIVGGGYIAAEPGHFFGTFGSDVTIIGRRPKSSLQELFMRIETASTNSLYTSSRTRTLTAGSPLPSVSEPSTETIEAGSTLKMTAKGSQQPSRIRYSSGGRQRPVTELALASLSSPRSWRRTDGRSTSPIPNPGERVSRSDSLETEHRERDVTRQSIYKHCGGMEQNVTPAA